MKSKNTYSLLVNSEEKIRSIFEGGVCGLLVASMAFASFTFASQAVTFPRVPGVTAAAAPTHAGQLLIATCAEGEGRPATTKTVPCKT